MDSKTYRERRERLRREVPDGGILLLGLGEPPRNYAANPYPFRQDSHFLYFTGVARPDAALLLTPDGGEIFFAVPGDLDTLVWSGAGPSPAELAAGAGVAQARELSQLPAAIAALGAAAVHYLPPYRADQTMRLAELLEITPTAVGAGASRALIRAIVGQRSIKDADEVAEIEDALGVSAAMFRAAAAAARPGKTEAEVAGAMQGAALAHDRQQAFLPIVSVRGEVLHNNSYGNALKAGDLLLLDYGAESPRFYASDITRVIPVAGRFDERQRAIYQVVLDAQLAVFAAASPHATNRELHFVAAKTIAAGLKSLGLMRGDVDEAVAAGAHALFFPHGIGHMLGLDVHDMEDLGDAVGYPEGEARSTQFGLAFLRLAKPLEPGFTITDEPGVYFNPPLLDMWAAEKRHAHFINYSEIRHYRRFGGVRIEDDILITADGARFLGPGIPKTPAELEELLRR